VCKRLNKVVSTGTFGASTEEDGQTREVLEEISGTRLQCTIKQERKNNAGRVLRNRGYR
jgi:hypothetical protein